MKKLFLLMGLASLFLVACNNNTPKQEQPQQQQTQEAQQPETVQTNPMIEQLLAEFDNWVNLADEQKDELNKKCLDYFAELEAQGIAWFAPEEDTKTLKAYVDPNTMSDEDRQAFEEQVAEQIEAWRQAHEADDVEELKEGLVEALNLLKAQLAE